MPWSWVDSVDRLAIPPSPRICLEAFHTIWRSAAIYRRDRGAPRGWIFGIARNAAIDWYRTAGRRAQRERELAEAWMASESDSVEEAATASADALRVRELVRELPQGNANVCV